MYDAGLGDGRGHAAVLGRVVAGLYGGPCETARHKIAVERVQSARHVQPMRSTRSDGRLGRFGLGIGREWLTIMVDYYANRIGDYLVDPVQLYD